MQLINRMRQVKILLVIAAVILSVASLIVSHFLVRDLELEEQRKMEIWAEAMRSFNNAGDETDLTLVWKVMNGNNTIPVVVLDSLDNVLDYRNRSIHAQNAADSAVAIRRKAATMHQADRTIRIDLSGAGYESICYADSLLLKRLAWWPYVQLGVVLSWERPSAA